MPAGYLICQIKMSDGLHTAVHVVSWTWAAPRRRAVHRERERRAGGAPVIITAGADPAVDRGGGVSANGACPGRQIYWTVEPPPDAHYQCSSPAGRPAAAAYFWGSRRLRV
eukprot:SAG31_NODE_6383_length_2037_cov_27.616615_4_plen_111_part_00